MQPDTWLNVAAFVTWLASGVPAGLAIADGPLAGRLRYEDQPFVSADVIGDSSSCVFDAPLTQAAGRFVKVFGWYDNEWGYTCRLADLAELVGHDSTLA